LPVWYSNDAVGADIQNCLNSPLTQVLCGISVIADISVVVVLDVLKVVAEVAVNANVVKEVVTGAADAVVQINGAEVGVAGTLIGLLKVTAVAAVHTVEGSDAMLEDESEKVTGVGCRVVAGVEG
jgi:hypothetical protein